MGAHIPYLYLRHTHRVLDYQGREFLAGTASLDNIGLLVRISIHRLVHTGTGRHLCSVPADIQMGGRTEKILVGLGDGTGVLCSRSHHLLYGRSGLEASGDGLSYSRLPVRMYGSGGYQRWV